MTKEKAKRYDEALEIAKKNYITAQDLCEGSKIGVECFKNTLENIFPELKESEDERILELIKKYVHYNISDMALNADHITREQLEDWLEKQSKKEYALKSFKDEDVRKFMQRIEKEAKAYDFNLPNRSYDIYAFAKDLLSWLEKQGKQFDDNIINSSDERIRKAILEGLIDCRDAPDLGWSNFGGIEIDDCIAWLEKQCEDKEINNFDVLPGLYKCVHRMFDGTPDSKLLFEVGNIYKCLSKHDIAEFEVSYGHSVYLEDPVVCKHFIPFKNQSEQKPTDWSEEDKEHIDSLLKRLEGLCRNKFERTRFAISEDENWLKSLKERIKEGGSKNDKKRTN